MARFAILVHDHPQLHWDFLLEWGPVARCWRLSAEPQAGEIPALAIADHRLLYLDYEGPVSGNRGQVVQWDSGTYEVIQHPHPSVSRLGREAGLAVHVLGKRWSGIAEIWPDSILFSPGTVSPNPPDIPM